MAKKRGVGKVLPAGSVAVWRSDSGEVPPESYPINFAFSLPEEQPDAENWDDAFRATGGEGSPEFLGRYAGGTTPKMSLRGLYGQGYWGELLGPQNEPPLIEWYNQQSAAHKAEWDGKPIPQELYDRALTTPRPAEVKPVDTRPLPAVGTPVEVRQNDKVTWQPDTIKGFSGQVVLFAKSPQRQKADRDKTWRVVGEAPPAPTPVEPPKPVDPIKPPPVATRPKIPAAVMLVLTNGHKWTKPGRLRAGLETAKAWLLTVADE